MCVGITIGRTQTCEDELRGTIQRKMRSMSLSSLVSRGGKATEGKGQEDGGESSPGQKKSFRNKFGSLKVNKKRGLVCGCGCGVCGCVDVCDDSIVCAGVEEVGMSLPSHGRHTSRPPLTSSTFQSDRKSPSRSHSLSSSEYNSVARPTLFPLCVCR